MCYCHECGTYSSRLHSCLLCVYFGCYTGNRHIHHHAQSTGHSLGTELEKIYFNLLPLCAIICGIYSCFRLLFSALDLSHGVVYCFVCRDNVYDLDLEKIRVEQASRAWKTIGKFCCVHITSGAIHFYYVLKPLEFTSQLVRESGDVL